MHVLQTAVYPLSKPCALVLDRFVGPDMITFFSEKDVRQLLRLHIADHTTDIGSVEGQVALNSLNLDDLAVISEGEIIDPESIIEVGPNGDIPQLPMITTSKDDEFLQKLTAAKKTSRHYHARGYSEPCDLC